MITQRVLNPIRRIILLSFLALMAIAPIYAEGKTRNFPLASYDTTGCRFKGRSQDCSDKVMTEILARGKDSIPILISQLTDTERTKKPAEQGWSYTLSGDVAYIMLISLFTDTKGTFNLTDVPTWKNVIKGCNLSMEGCWREYVRKNGRKSVQKAWMDAWNLHKDNIHWDPAQRCFEISKK
jgi:hypothetical protein